MLNLDNAKKLAAASFTSGDGKEKAAKLVGLVFTAKLTKDQALAAIGSLFASAAGKKKAADLIGKIYAERKLVVGEVYDVTGEDDETDDLRVVVKVSGVYGIMWTRRKSGRISCKSTSLEGTAKKFFERYPHAEKSAATIASAM